MTANSRDDVLNLIRQFAGQQNTLVIPRPFITLCGGDHLAALLLNQILYWSDRTDDADGWFAKSAVEWHDELAMSTYQVTRAIKVLLKIGVETSKRRSRYHGMAPTLHYRINWDQFSKCIFEKLENPDLRETAKSDFQETRKSYTEITTETIKEIPPAVPASKKEASNAWYDAVLAVWGYTGARNGAMGKLLRGEATAKGYREYNLTTPLTEPGQVLAWRDWYRHVKGKDRADTIIVAKPEKVQSSIGEWQLSLSQPPAPAIVYHRAPDTPPVYNGPSPEQIKADLARVRAEMAATGRANGARH